jgi:hypothetical protein
MFSDQIYPSRGFSSSDLALLSQIQARQTRYGAWSRVQLVQDGPSDFLAVWDADAEDSDPPTLVVARFKGTGTYALTRGHYLVATGRTLREVVAPIDGGTSAESAPTEGPLA